METINFSEKINYQPILNLGFLGSVSDGKSTAVYQLTGTKTQKHSSELKRNITIKPGYANMKIFRDSDDNYYSSNSSTSTYENPSGEECELVHHLSFVDCPGHHQLILTMLGSIDLMQGAIVVVSAAESIDKKPQLIQHLAAAKLANLDNIIICLNKLDLIPIELARERKRELDMLLERLEIEPKAIIPTSFSKGIGVDNLLRTIMEIFSPSDIMSEEIVQFRTTRSFDVNKPGTSWDKITGGILGGSLITGKLKVGDMLEIRPGIIGKDPKGKVICTPLKTKLLSIQTDREKVDDILPGGLMGLGTDIDPYYCRNDTLAGNIVGIEGSLPSVYNNIEMSYTPTTDFGGEWKPKVGSIVNLQIGTLSIDSRLMKYKKKTCSFDLSRPVCINIDSLVLISVKESSGLKIVGFGHLKGGKVLYD